MKKKFAVLLSGCGHKDGTEITEAVSSLIALSQLGVEYQCFAPNQNFPSLNHINGEPQSERNAMVEASRISRGECFDIVNLKSKDFDGIVIPGGYGAAKNLSNFASAGSKGSVHEEVRRVIKEFHSDMKPICAICISPAVLALVLGRGITVTLGEDSGASQELIKTGASHEVCAVEDFVSDRENRIITSPAYMYDAKPAEVFAGVAAAIREAVEMA